MTAIERLDPTVPPEAVVSRCVVWGDTVHIGGLTAPDLSGDVGAQMSAVLEIVDGYLKQVGSDRQHLLTVQVWISDMALFDEMTAVWNDWVDPAAAPSRACVSGRLSDPRALVEVSAMARIVR